MSSTLFNNLVKIGDSIIDKTAFYTPKETEAILGVKYCTIYQLVRKGSLKRSGENETIFYKGEDIVDFLENGRS